MMWILNMENMKCSFILQLECLNTWVENPKSHTHTMGSMQLCNSSLLEGRGQILQPDACCCPPGCCDIARERQTDRALYLGHGGLGQSGVKVGALQSQEK